MDRALMYAIHLTSISDMIPRDVLEFQNRWNKEPCKGDIIAMRLQRAIIRTKMDDYEILMKPNLSESGMWRIPEFVYELRFQMKEILELVPYDGNVHLRWMDPDGKTETVDVHVPRNARRFYGTGISKAFKKKREDALQAEFRRRKLQPFLESLRPWLVKGSRKISIQIGSIVDTQDRLSFRMEGQFTLKEMEAILKGIEESHVLDDEIIKHIMEA
jgi:hypothetical protein